jgi:hypothetical protein
MENNINLFLNDVSNENIDDLILQLKLYISEDAVLLKRKHIIKILNDRLNNKISEKTLRKWASEIEFLDFIDYEEEYNNLIANTIFEIATPEINSELTSNFLRKIIAQLG